MEKNLFQFLMQVIRNLHTSRRLKHTNIMAEDYELISNSLLEKWLGSGTSLENAARAWLMLHVKPLDNYSRGKDIMAPTEVQEPSLTQKGVEWLRPMWEYSDKKPEFDLILTEWIKVCPDLEYLLTHADRALIEAWPIKPEYGNEITYGVIIKPLGMKKLRAKKPREGSRQVSFNGKHYDTRNGRNQIILLSPIETLADLAPIWIDQLEAEQDLRASRGMRLQLERLYALRGKELTPELRDRILTGLKSHAKRMNGRLEKAECAKCESLS
jgi:hypothetical protein